MQGLGPAVPEEQAKDTVEAGGEGAGVCLLARDYGAGAVTFDGSGTFLEMRGSVIDIAVNRGHEIIVFMPGRNVPRLAKGGGMAVGQGNAAGWIGKRGLSVPPPMPRGVQHLFECFSRGKIWVIPADNAADQAHVRCSPMLGGVPKPHCTQHTFGTNRPLCALSIVSLGCLLLGTGQVSGRELRQERACWCNVSAHADLSVSDDRDAARFQASAALGVRLLLAESRAPSGTLAFLREHVSVTLPRPAPRPRAVRLRARQPHGSRGRGRRQASR